MIFQTIDEAGVESIHECSNEEIAKQLHLLHYGLLAINFKEVKRLPDNITPCFELMCLSYCEKLEHEKGIAHKS